MDTNATPIDLTFTTKAPGLKPGRLAVFDADGKLVYNVEPSSWNLRQLLLDSTTGHPILSMKLKLSSTHQRWQVFKGSSSYPSDLLFSVKTGPVFQLRTKVDVFLAANKKEEVCDFRIKGSYGKRSCTVYNGQTSTVVAEMSSEKKVELGKHAFVVTVARDVDSAFIVALVAILHELQRAASYAVSGASDGVMLE